MSVASDGGHPVDPAKKRKLLPIEDVPLPIDYGVYTKPNYKRLFPEYHSGECVVYVESTEQEKIGNKNPITLTNIFSENVKGFVGIHRVNAYKLGVTFRKPAPANSFLKMESFLSWQKLKAFIPAYMTETTGVIRYVPKDMSNEDIYKSISCDAEIISIKRFMRKVEGKLTPLATIAVTFAGTSLPQHAYIKLFRYPVHTYIPPLVQCYKCLKFNHSAKACRGAQMCSSCAGQHSYKECTAEAIICINCSGNHLAISRDCPIKKRKMEEKRSKLMNRTYATVAKTSPMMDPQAFPALGKKMDKVSDDKLPTKLDANLIINNDIIINAIVKSLVALGNGNNGDNLPITNKKIKEILLSNLI